MKVEEQIRKYVAESFLFSGNGYGYPDEASFLEEGIVDSTGVLELVMYVEEQFGVSVEDEDIVPDNFDSVARLSAYVRRKQLLAQAQRAHLRHSLRRGYAV